MGQISKGIDSYGVSMTTLEEIFLKLGEEEESKKEEMELAVWLIVIDYRDNND